MLVHAILKRPDVSHECFDLRVVAETAHRQRLKSLGEPELRRRLRLRLALLPTITIPVTTSLRDKLLRPQRDDDLLRYVVVSAVPYDLEIRPQDLGNLALALAVLGVEMGPRRHANVRRRIIA